VTNLVQKKDNIFARIAIIIMPISELIVTMDSFAMGIVFVTETELV